jgi:polysaccharide biosynthesis protein PslH
MTRRSLMIAPAMPSDQGNGLAMRLGVFLEALAACSSVDLAVIPAAGPAFPASPLVERVGARLVSLQSAGPVDTHFGLVQRVGDHAARLAAFRSYGRPSLAAAVTAAVRAELREIASAGYDLVHVGRLYLGEAALDLPGHPLLSLDLDEDDGCTFRSLAAAERQRDDTARTRADWADAEADAFDRLSSRVAPRFDQLWISSAHDRLIVAARTPAIAPVVVPNTAHGPSTPERRDDGSTLLFVGSLRYAPNEDGLLWFAGDVLPLLRQRLGRAPRLLIVGADPPSAIRALAEQQGVEVLGFVPDLSDMYACASAAIVPLRAGGGTRIKIIEAAAHGVPTVSTSIGVSGLAFANGEQAWIADDAASFAEACAQCLTDAGERQRRGASALELARKLYDRSGVVDALAQRLYSLLETRAPRGS